MKLAHEKFGEMDNRLVGTYLSREDYLRLWLFAEAYNTTKSALLKIALRNLFFKKPWDSEAIFEKMANQPVSELVRLWTVKHQEIWNQKKQRLFELQKSNITEVFSDFLLDLDTILMEKGFSDKAREKMLKIKI